MSCPARAPGEPDVFAENQDRFHNSHVNGSSFSRPRAPSINKCPLCTRLRGQVARHRAHGFATVEPASGALSSLECSRTERLDPTRYQRFITSGHVDHTPLVDFCNRSRSASTTGDLPSPARAPRFPLKASLAGDRAPFRAQPAEDSQARGQHSKRYHRHPSTAIARRGSLSPT